MKELQPRKDINKKTTDDVNIPNESKETARQYHERMAYKTLNYVDVVVTHDNAGKIVQEFIDKLNQRSIERQKQLNVKKPDLVQDFENWQENPAHYERIQVNMMRTTDTPTRATSLTLDYSDQNMANLSGMRNTFLRFLSSSSVHANLKGILRNTEGCIDNIVFFDQHRGGAQGYEALVSIDNALASLRRNKASIDGIRWNNVPNIATLRQHFDTLNGYLGNALDSD